ncbi:hypothetical protein LTR29_016599 [Friedmanniomyces endolithicus]|uniref:Protein kinase domain-containing protein n=1 Tax=Rachicladosporium monterosium TaxID=1507873 RepID=A0ABR0LB78_9PEZI|nr:hypothetical protein LTR29_016599 [Friedmanniomyces endolithicus]KAK5146256.1 hypothetical protein LTR32_002134 [Rachicladosporium monterosium]
MSSTVLLLHKDQADAHNKAADLKHLGAQADGENPQDDVPDIRSERDLTVLCEVEDAATGAFLRSTYDYIDRSDFAWFGRMPGVRKYDLTVEDLKSTLKRVPDEHIYPIALPSLTVFRPCEAHKNNIYIKRPQLASCDDANVAALLPRLMSDEATVLECLKKRPHPNLIKYHGCTLKDGRVTGLALEKHDVLLLYRYEDRPLPFNTAACMDGIRAGVRHLHSLGLAHNDLNPMNILLDQDDHPVIIDFGSCKKFGEHLISAGTPGWIDEEYVASAREHDEAALLKIDAWLAARYEEFDRGRGDHACGAVPHNIRTTPKAMDVSLTQNIFSLQTGPSWRRAALHHIRYIFVEDRTLPFSFLAAPIPQARRAKENTFRPALQLLPVTEDSSCLRERFGLLSEVGQLLLPQSLRSTTVTRRARPLAWTMTLIVVMQRSSGTMGESNGFGRGPFMEAYKLPTRSVPALQLYTYKGENVEWPRIDGSDRLSTRVNVTSVDPADDLSKAALDVMCSWGDSGIRALCQSPPSLPWIRYGSGFSSPPVRAVSSVYTSGQTALSLEAAARRTIIIYEMVHGGMVLYIGSGTPQVRIYHLVCTRPDKISESDHQFHEITKRPSSAPREDYLEAGVLLPLLITCRKIYSETIHTLYSSNTFQFTSNHGAFRSMKVMIPHHRIQSIRHFRMTMRVPHHPHMNTRSRRDWSALWDFFVNEMTGLQNLYLKFLMLYDTQEGIGKT